MITLGIDLSSMPKSTAACRIEWQPKQAVSDPPHLRCTDDQLDMLILKSDAVGIDAPFGWPAEFAITVGQWVSAVWNEDVRDRLRFRLTDRWVREQFGLTPLSVSTDRIALPAMRAMALLHRHGVTDRGGDGRFFEVYPAGSLRVWGLPAKAYKTDTSKARKERRTILNGLRKEMRWLAASGDYAESADALDSLVASLTARAAAQNLTHGPFPSQIDLARREGWIHLPKQFPLLYESSGTTVEHHC